MTTPTPLSEEEEQAIKHRVSSSSSIRLPVDIREILQRLLATLDKEREQQRDWNKAGLDLNQRLKIQTLMTNRKEGDAQ